jgi:hypothetical protein
MPNLSQIIKNTFLFLRAEASPVEAAMQRVELTLVQKLVLTHFS